MNTKLKFGAECFHDAECLIKLIPGDCVISILVTPSMIIQGIPLDCEVTLELEDFNINQVADLMSTIPDSHVMLQTLNYHDLYTGERTR